MIYRLGTIEVDPDNFLLKENGEAVAVEPLVFDLIVYLIKNRDRLITRRELFDEIWPGRVVSDTSLSNHIKSARKALRDDGQSQKFIKTVHGRGYRFVGDVQTVEPQPVRSDRKATGGRLLLIAAAIVFLAAIAGPLLLITPDRPIESIAVLPLTNLSNDPAQSYFVEGMQDALITRLSRITELRVISKTSTLRYESTDKPIPEIARELNVDALIEGSVLRDEDRVRISAKLIRGPEDEHLWANNYDRDLDHALSLINEISIAIADEVEATVREEETGDAVQRRSVDIEVHELVLQGRHYFDRFMFDQALRHYQQATNLDAGFAPAHAGVAASMVLKGFFTGLPRSEFVPAAREAALRAISLDAKSAGGYSSLGFIQLYYDWDWDAARSSLLTALELSPNDAGIRHAYADYLLVMGDVEESLNQVEIALLYDPFSPMASGVVGFHKLLARQYDVVLEESRRAIASEPESLVNLSNYREVLWLKGLHEEALAAYKSTWGKDPELLEAMETGYSQAGYSGAVLSLANTLAGRDPAFRDHVTLARLYARAGEADRALASLESAYEHRQPQILHMKAMPVFDDMHAYPGFQDLLRRVGFPDTARR